MKKGMMFFLLTALLIACGGDKKNEKKESEGIKLKAPTEASKEEAQDGVTKVYLSGNDKMKFNTNEIKVPAGNTIELTFEHVGKMSKETMGHNFVLLKEGTNVQEFGQEALNFKDNDYIPEGSEAIIVHTEMLGGGQKTTITFEAPKKGNYNYICSFPGHVALMNGVFIVE
jgi:azurin